MNKLKQLFNEYKEDKMFWLLFILFFFLWFITTVIFTAFCLVYDIEMDAGSIGAYANFLVFDATIFAPIAAYFFIDNWKNEKQYDLEKEQILKVLDSLIKVSTDLNTIKINTNEIKKVKNEFYYAPNLITKNNINIQDFTGVYIKIITDLNLYYKYSNKIYNDEYLIKFKNNCLLTYQIYRNEILTEYKKYIDKIEDNNLCKIQGVKEERSYDHSPREDGTTNDFFFFIDLADEIELIFIKEKSHLLNNHITGEESEEISNFNHFISVATNETDNIINFCIDKIKLNNTPNNLIKKQG